MKIPDNYTSQFIRISSLDRLAACSASWAESKGKPSVGSEAASFGSAGHKVYEKMAKREHVDYPTICAFYGVGTRAKELQQLIERAEFFPAGDAEVAVEYHFGSGDEHDPNIPFLSGHIDLVQPNVVVDYKFSQLRGNMDSVDERVQVPAYAWVAAKRYAWDEVTAQTFNPFMGPKGWSSVTYNKAQIDEGLEMVQELAEIAAYNDMVEPAKRNYTPGSHCGYCPGRITCPAIKAQLQAVACLDRDNLPTTREALPALVAFAKDLEKRAATVIEYARENVKTSGDIIGDDMSLVGSVQMRTPSLSAAAILEWLETHNYAALVNDINAELGNRPKIETFVMRVKKSGKDK